MDRSKLVDALLGPATMNPNLEKQGRIARGLMAPPTSVMDERYPAWKKSQDQAEQFLIGADILSSAIPAAVLAAPYAKKGLLSLGAAASPRVENYMARTGLLQPATVWHGSPHRFDKFDASKIGTGEGAQAYGHGLYLAESPDVARSYQKALSGRVKSANVGADVPLGDARGIAHEIATVHRGNVEEFIKSNRLHYALEESKASAIGNTNRAKVLREIADENEAIAKQFLGKPVTAAPEGGSLYKVDLPDEAIAKMLDWDKPLSQQSPEVQALLQKAAQIRAQQTGGAFGPLDMNQIGKNVIPTLGEQRLQQAGITGIRYLDGGSRGTGAGTSNYVVFPGNESLLKILSRE